MNKAKQQQSQLLFLLLAGLFIAALVTCNLIAQKFVTVDLSFLGFSEPFIISAGVLPYPITFLITDLLSEFYGRKRTNQVVWVGLIGSLFVVGILALGGAYTAIPSSPVSDEAYTVVFGNGSRVIFASMIAYLFAQTVDVHLFHFWKKLTKGKHLWLRNNASTILSQLVDTTLVVLVLFIGNKPWGEMFDMIGDGWLFKLLVALADTAVLYLLVYGIRKYFRLKRGQEF